METKSVLINGGIGFLKKLDEYSKYSLIYRVFAYIGRLIMGSGIFKLIKNGLLSPIKRDYLAGSFLLGIVLGVFKVILRTGKKMYIYLSKLNKKSMNKKVFNKVISPFSKVGGVVSVLTGVLGGICLSLTIYYAATNFSLFKVGIFAIIGLISFGICFLMDKKMAEAIKSSIPKKMVFWFFDGI